MPPLPDSVRRVWLPLTIAILLTIAFHFSWIQGQSISLTLRFAAHASVVPLLAMLMLHQPLPTIAWSRDHIRLAVLGTTYVFLLILFLGWFGFDATYRDWRIATVAGLSTLPLIWLALRASVAAAPVSSMSGWWQLGAVAIVLSLWPNGYAGEVSPVGDMVSNFFLTGMTEEFVFRGVIQGYLLSHWRGKWLGVSTANWFTAFLFAWMHNLALEPERLPWFLYLVPMGLFYGVLRDRTGSWVLPGIVHGLIIPALYFWATLGIIDLPTG